jgi:hypothetical protein
MIWFDGCLRRTQRLAQDRQHDQDARERGHGDQRRRDQRQQGHEQQNLNTHGVVAAAGAARLNRDQGNCRLRQRGVGQQHQQRREQGECGFHPRPPSGFAARSTLAKSGALLSTAPASITGSLNTCRVRTLPWATPSSSCSLPASINTTFSR